MGKSDVAAPERAFPLDWTHKVAKLPSWDKDTSSDAAARAFKQVARADELAVIASLMDIPACESFSSEYSIAPLRRGRFLLRGRLRARVVQSCVVTLADVPADIDESFEAEFWPAAQIASSDEPGAETEYTLDDLETRDIEPIDDGIIDAGRYIYEVLASGLEPYPRAPGAVFDAAAAGGGASSSRGDKRADGEDGGENPFKVLEKLKHKDS